MDTTNFAYNDEQFADIQMLRYRMDGFEKLTCRQKELAYYLSEAALTGRDILWDQNGKYNLRIRKTLEAIYTHYEGDRQSDDFKQFVVYLKRVWFSNGIHHHYGCEKFTPGFSATFFHEAINSIPTQSLPLEEGQTTEDLYNRLYPVIFCPDVMPKRVSQTDGEDLLQTSASNYYADDITQEEAEAFYANMKKPDDPCPLMYGMNSRLVKENGILTEKTWKSGGLYG